jgi:hypothetical protein
VSWFVWIPLGLVALYVVMGVYLATVMKWGDDQTVGLKYYGRSPQERERFKKNLALHATMLAPMLWLNGRMAKLDFQRARIQYKGVSGPTGSCSEESFQRAESYQPSADDVFVVTQMKCGTTWMQHVVYEILNRGRGNLVESGIAMYAVSPWLEGTEKRVGPAGAADWRRASVADHQDAPAGDPVPVRSVSAFHLRRAPSRLMFCQLCGLRADERRRDVAGDAGVRRLVLLEGIDVVGNVDRSRPRLVALVA